MKRLVFHTLHNDPAGGGAYCANLIDLFSEYFDVYAVGAVDTLPGLTAPLRPFDGSFVPDVFLAAAHNGQIAPMPGTVNWHVCFYPRPELAAPKQFDLAICLNAFVQREAERHWGIRTHIIHPYVEADHFRPGPKKNKIVNIGTFFLEPDGNTKNQHLVLEWFAKWRHYEQYELHFIGWNAKPEYTRMVMDVAARVPNVFFHLNATREALIQHLAEARFLIHAHGYQRDLARNPHETEHFGYIVVESFLSGCQPIVHNSGGARDFSRVLVYDDIDEVNALMARSHDIPALVAAGRVFDRAGSLAQARALAATVIPAIETSKAPPVVEIGCGDNPITPETPDIHHRMIAFRLDAQALPAADIVAVTTALPFADGAIGGIVSQHVIEHHSHGKGNGGVIGGTLRAFLQEAHRVLVPGGFFESMSPNLAFIAAQYMARGRSDTDYAEQLMEWAMGGQRDPWDFHYCLLDFNILERLARQVGFASAELLHPVDWFGLHVLLRK